MSDVQSVTLNEFDAAMANQFKSSVASKSEDVAIMPKKIPPMTSINIGNIYSDMLIKGLEDGTSPFLPKNGVIDLKPAYNMASNDLHKGVAQIQFQLDAAKHGYTDLGYVTLQTLLKARAEAQKNGETCGYKKGSLPVTTFVVPRDKDGTALPEKPIQWYHSSQIENLPFLQEFCKKEMSQKTQEYNQYIQEQKAAGDPKYKDWQPKTDPSTRDMSAPNKNRLKYSGQTGADYLGQILAAASTGHKLLVEDSVAKTMADYMARQINREVLGKNGKKVSRGIVFNQFVATANEKCKISVKMLNDDRAMSSAQKYFQKQEQKQQKTPKKEINSPKLTQPSPAYGRGR